MSDKNGKTIENDKIDIKEKVSQGWIHVNSIIELMGVREDIVESNLENHVNKIENENGILIAKKTFSSLDEVKNPPKNIKQAYSQFVEMDMVFRNYSMLIYYVFTYGPSSIQILEPNSITLKQGEAEDITNALASLIHQFASNAGGIVVKKQ